MKYEFQLQVGPVGFRIGSEWAGPIEALRALYAGYPEPDGRYTFRPDRTATRAEVAAMLVRALGETLETGG